MMHCPANCAPALPMWRSCWPMRLPLPIWPPRCFASSPWWWLPDRDIDWPENPVFSMGDMAGESILLPRHDCSYKMIFEGMLAEAGVDSVVFMVLNSIEAIKKCVLQGIGVAMIPRMSVKEEIDQKKMVALALPEENLETAVLMIWHKEKWVSPTLQAFMETVRRVMSKEGGP